MSMASEFKEFALKGNVMDLAVGVIIGGAFGKIVDSMVKDLVMPLVNLITGGQIDFSNNTGFRFQWNIRFECDRGTYSGLDNRSRRGHHCRCELVKPRW